MPAPSGFHSCLAAVSGWLLASASAIRAARRQQTPQLWERGLGVFVGALIAPAVLLLKEEHFKIRR